MIDMNKFTPGTQPAKDDGLLTILEEIPGQTHWEDMTATLSKEGFWSVAYHLSLPEKTPSHPFCVFGVVD